LGQIPGKIIVDLSVGYADRVAVLFIFEQIQIPYRYKILCFTDNVTEQKFLRRLNFQEKLRVGGKIETPCLLATF
jgi:hypothetical protein